MSIPPRASLQGRIFYVCARGSLVKYGLNVRRTYKNGAAVTLYLPPMTLLALATLSMCARFLLNATRRPSLHFARTSGSYFEREFTDTATNTPVANDPQKVDVLTRIMVVSRIEGRS